MLHLWVNIKNIPPLFGTLKWIEHIASATGKFVHLDVKLFENEGKVRVYVAHDIKQPLCIQKSIKSNAKDEQEDKQVQGVPPGFRPRRLGEGLSKFKFHGQTSSPAANSPIPRNLESRRKSELVHEEKENVLVEVPSAEPKILPHPDPQHLPDSQPFPGSGYRDETAPISHPDPATALEILKRDFHSFREQAVKERAEAEAYRVRIAELGKGQFLLRAMLEHRNMYNDSLDRAARVDGTPDSTSSLPNQGQAGSMFHVPGRP
ncbi:hypothetical protein ACLB2K_007056 [Fragaria x ananassa]